MVEYCSHIEGSIFETKSKFMLVATIILLSDLLCWLIQNCVHIGALVEMILLKVSSYGFARYA